MKTGGIYLDVVFSETCEEKFTMKKNEKIKVKNINNNVSKCILAYSYGGIFEVKKNEN